MQLHILDAMNALEHKPDVATYAIRIFDTDKRFHDTLRQPLIQSRNYISINDYAFDDIDCPKPGKQFITSDIASKIITDFREGKENCESLLIHCTAGENRSPAVAMALSQIFPIGIVTTKINEDYSYLNRSVYKQLLNSAKDLGLGNFEYLRHPEFNY